MEQREPEFDYFDPIYSEYNPLSEEIRKELQGLLKPERKEDTGALASLIRKMMPCP